jgi:hypothetical protein
MNCLINYYNHLLSTDTLTHVPIGAGLSLIAFIIYLECNSTLGNIWYRISDDGTRRVSLTGLLYFLARPFTDKLFWNCNMWDLNSVIFITAGTMLYTTGIRSLIFFYSHYINCID